MDKKFSIRQLAASVVLAIVITACLTVMALNSFNSIKNRYVISFDADEVSYENIKKFNQVRNILKKDYYLEVDENQLIEGAVAGLAEALNDPYTVYFNEDRMKTFLEKSEGSYVGIGVTVNVDEKGLLTVIEPGEDSPAAEAGMKKGDKIVKVGDTDVTAISDENMVISMIKGKENTKVKITVYRPDEDIYKQFEITRRRIKTSNIKSEILEGNIGYIRLVMFDNEIADYFKIHLNKLLQNDIRGLIIDLRDNPGGSYEQVVEIADTLLPEGTIVYTENREGKREYKKSDKAHVDLPLAILINGNSASASEILAGAVKDHGRGTLVGTKTFGKGLVQELKILEDNSGIKVTISRYFTPSDVCIHGTGISPDIEVDVMNDYRSLPASQIPRASDIQLQSAIEAVRQNVKQK